MSEKIIGVDIDGVLAQWNDAYAKLVTQHTGIEFPKEDATWPTTWDWDLVGGVSMAQRAEVWKDIKSRTRFWYDLPPYPEAEEFLKELYDLEDNVYFITQRAGVRVKEQTEDWLHKHGFPNATVLIVGKDCKGDVAKALELTHYIDDKIENCQDILIRNPAGIGYMLARPWNYEIPRVPRLNSLKEFMDVLKEEK